MMSFYEFLTHSDHEKIDRALAATTRPTVERALAREYIQPIDFISFLSKAAEPYLEEMARRAQVLTLMHFGRTIRLYTPLYLSDHCVNQCVYCGFNVRNTFPRRTLNLKEIEREAVAIAATGLRHLLILTGESRSASPIRYLQECVEILKRYFHAIEIEIYPLTETEYADLVAAGVDGLTLYQETYNEAVYRQVHPGGPKKDFRFRLEAPERGAKGRMRQVSIGALLGLADWRKEVFFMGCHALHLMEQYPDIDIGASVPRLRPHTGSFPDTCRVTDRNLVQAILALRLFLPKLGISLSTREAPAFRDNLLPLGVTRMSAGSVTSVGGHVSHSHGETTLPQFEIADHRTVEDMVTMIHAKGYDPVLSDWISDGF